ncbi:MAG: toll/interleukin-1 receptor domain-containing protein [Pseudonocardiales bacterium]|nr:toll/interleukin-1 receptor domain-containing protein [Pseudonocardiales bacterium]
MEDRVLSEVLRAEGNMTDLSIDRFKIFICYRRSDSAATAGRLRDLLARSLGIDSVFMDVESIRPGMDFVTSITQAVGSSDVVLGLIGKSWLEVRDKSGRRRIDNSHDYLRLELETALKCSAELIPVLVDDATMPDESELPHAIAALARRQSMYLRNVTFHNDANRILGVIAEIASRSDSPWKRLQGHWYGDWGNSYFLVVRDSVRVVYDYRNGRILANIRGNMISGWWAEEPTRQPPDNAGEVEFSLPDGGDASNLKGRWWYGSKNSKAKSWRLEKVGNTIPLHVKVELLNRSKFPAGRQNS